jgi:phenol 2-monooxygenase
MSLEIDDSQIDNPDAYSVTVRVLNLFVDDGVPEQYGHKIHNRLHRQFRGDEDREVTAESYETIHVKYVLGTDGAHSCVRKQIDIVPVGEATDHMWGVLDIVPIMDFLNIRKRCSIHSTDDGSVMVIPREFDVVRF